MTQIAPRAHTPARAHVRAHVGTPLLREVYGRLLRGLRTRQSRTLAEVAARAGISVAYLSEVERGLKEPSSEVLEAICIALGSSITGLVGAAHRELRDLTSEGATGRVLDLTSRVGSSIATPLGGATPTGTLLEALPDTFADTTGHVLLAA
jgi:transcriptional regulator with XRE-family HTH domain